MRSKTDCHFTVARKESAIIQFAEQIPELKLVPVVARETREEYEEISISPRDLPSLTRASRIRTLGIFTHLVLEKSWFDTEKDNATDVKSLLEATKHALSENNKPIRAQEVENSNDVKICSGSLGGTYDQFVDDLNSATEDRFKKVPTSGSHENIELLEKGDCDLTISQSDVASSVKDASLYTSFEIFSENAHLICHKDLNINFTRQFSNNLLVLTGEKGSGSARSWNRLIDLNSNLGRAKTGSASTLDAFGKVLRKEADCFFEVSRTQSAIALKYAASHPKLRILPLSSSDQFFRKNRLYKKNLFTLLGKRKSVPTLGVSTLLLVSKQLESKLSNFDNFEKAIARVTNAWSTQ